MFEVTFSDLVGWFHISKSLHLLESMAKKKSPQNFAEQAWLEQTGWQAWQALKKKVQFLYLSQPQATGCLDHFICPYSPTHTATPKKGNGSLLASIA